METAYQWAKETEGIVTFTFHWFSPIGGRDKSFYAEHTDFDASRVLEEGSPERTAFFHDMDVIAESLKRFCEADIPILWRPFHESEGTWFWWGAKGAEIARELYKLMFVHYTQVHHLDNLLWVWNCPLKEGYPGDEYVDVVSVDIYLENMSLLIIGNTMRSLWQPQPETRWQLWRRWDIFRIFISWSSPVSHGHII